MKRLAAIASLIVLLLGGLYLYMNRFDYLDMGKGEYVRINKLTGHECLMVQGFKPHLDVRKRQIQDGLLVAPDFCDK